MLTWHENGQTPTKAVASSVELEPIQPLAATVTAEFWECDSQTSTDLWSSHRSTRQHKQPSREVLTMS